MAKRAFSRRCYPDRKQCRLRGCIHALTASDSNGRLAKKLYCVSESTGLNLATYYRNRFYFFNSKKSILDISSPVIPYADVLVGMLMIATFSLVCINLFNRVVTWVIMEKKARDRRRAARNAAASGGGGGGGG
ncbi:hypothetical protein FS749_009333 [Ceratobasidium sp. UAMH 11750]|nr:hypothetical protein FS749_009333 [Ceratobasidium sp. UAMH 11750]